jgi:hypothetical protein
MAGGTMPLRQALDEFGHRGLHVGPRVLEIGAGRERTPASSPVSTASLIS